MQQCRQTFKRTKNAIKIRRNSFTSFCMYGTKRFCSGFKFQAEVFVETFPYCSTWCCFDVVKRMCAKNTNCFTLWFQTIFKSEFLFTATKSKSHASFLPVKASLFLKHTETIVQWTTIKLVINFNAQYKTVIKQFYSFASGSKSLE